MRVFPEWNGLRLPVWKACNLRGYIIHCYITYYGYNPLINFKINLFLINIKMIISPTDNSKQNVFTSQSIVISYSLKRSFGVVD